MRTTNIAQLKYLPDQHWSLMREYFRLLNEVNAISRLSLYRALIEDHIRTKLLKLARIYTLMSMDPFIFDPQIKTWLKQTSTDCKSYTEHLSSLEEYFALPLKILKALAIFIFGLMTFAIFGDTVNLIEIIGNPEQQIKFNDFLVKDLRWIGLFGTVITISILFIFIEIFDSAAAKKTEAFCRQALPILPRIPSNRIRISSLEDALFNNIGLNKGQQIPIDLIVAYSLLTMALLFSIILIFFMFPQYVWVPFAFYIILLVNYFLSWRKQSKCIESIQFLGDKPKTIHK